MTTLPDKQTTYVYLFTNTVNGKCYVGISTAPNRRKRNHIVGNGSKALYAAMLKYGMDAFEFKILSKHHTYSGAAKREIKDIKKYNSITPNGYNLSTGGEQSSLGVKHLPETIQKYRDWARTPAYAAKLSAAKVGRKLPPSTRMRMSNAHKGHKVSEDTRTKLSVANKGRRFPERTGENSPRALPVMAQGQKFVSFKSASVALGIPQTSLRRQLIKNQKTDPDNWGYLKKTTP